MGKFDKVPVLGMAWGTFVFALVGILLVGGLLNNMGVLPKELSFLTLASVIPETAPATASAGTTVANAPVSTELQVTTVDLKSSVRESQPDTTGVKNRIGGSVAWYYDGDVTPFETTTLSTTAFASSTNDATPGKTMVGIFTNASYYSHKIANADGSALEIPISPSMEITSYADLLNTISIRCQNSSATGWLASGANQTLGTDEAVTLDCKLMGGSARGVFKGPIKLCLNYSTANLSTTGTYVVGATKGTVPSGISAGYETCWDTSLPDVVDFNSVPFQVRVTTASGINPANAPLLTFQAIDCGATYTKTLWPVLFQGCENADTLAAIGSTDATYVVWLD